MLLGLTIKVGARCGANLGDMSLNSFRGEEVP